MPEQKHHKHPHEQMEEENGNGPAGVEAAEEQQAEIEALQKRADEAEAKAREVEAKAAQNLDGWQRSVAEFQNYKKRIDRDRESDKAIMKGDLIKRFLPVLDDLERALKDRPADSSWAAGIMPAPARRIGAKPTRFASTRWSAARHRSWPLSWSASGRPCRTRRGSPSEWERRRTERSPHRSRT